MTKLEDNLGFLVARTHRAMRRWIMARLDPLNLTYEQYKVLIALSEQDNVSQTELADRVNMDKTSLARMLDRMEAAGLVSRCPDAADSRINRMQLTESGRAVMTQVIPLRDLGLDQATQGMDDKEVQKLKQLLNIVYRNMTPQDK